MITQSCASPYRSYRLDPEEQMRSTNSKQKTQRCEAAQILSQRRELGWLRWATSHDNLFVLAFGSLAVRLLWPPFGHIAGHSLCCSPSPVYFLVCQNCLLSPTFTHHGINVQITLLSGHRTFRRIRCPLSVFVFFIFASTVCSPIPHAMLGKVTLTEEQA